MKISWKLLRLVPKHLRYKMIRNNFEFSTELPDTLIFKVADTTDEIQQAYQIIHDGYVERDLMDENLEKIRVTKFSCLPTTTLMICKHHDEVIATITLIADSSFGLPTEDYRNLDEFRNQGLKLFEVSGLAIKKNNQAKRGKLLLAMFKYMFEYARNHVKADALILSTVAEVKDFYRALFFSHPLDNDKVLKFSNVKGRETVSQILYVNKTTEMMQKTFDHLPLNKNLYHFLIRHTFSQFLFPERKYHFTVGQILSIQQMKHFFVEKSSVMQGLTQKEKFQLSEYYHFDQFKKIIFDDPSALQFGRNRNSLRTPVACRATLNKAGTLNSFKSEVNDVSLDGLRITSTEETPELHETFNLNIEISKSHSAKVMASVVWVKGKSAGLKIIESSHQWQEMIQDAHSLYQKDQALEVA
jgi:hypothetical protein